MAIVELAATVELPELINTPIAVLDANEETVADPSRTLTTLLPELTTDDAEMLELQFLVKAATADPSATALAVVWKLSSP